MSDIRITNAPADLKDDIARYCRETFEEHRERQPHAFPKNSFEAILGGGLEKAFRDPSGQPLRESPVIFTAFIGDKFAGYIHLSDWVRPGRTDMPFISITDIYVIPEFRESGVARALIEHVKSLADERDWDNLTANVWSGNTRSDELFRAAGFRQDSVSYRYGPDRPARDWPEPESTPSGLLSRIFTFAASWNGAFFIVLFMIVLAWALVR